MKKKIPANYDEIDLIPILKIIWNGRIKILLIVIVSLLIGLGYLYQLPNEYSYTSNIEKNDNSEFEKFKILTLDTYLENPLAKVKSPLIQETYVVDKFIYELKDNKELMFVLKDTKNFRENFAKSQTLEKKGGLFKHTKLLEIKKIDDSNIVLNLKWHDSEEIIDILKDTINLTIDNLEKSIIEDLNKIIEINNLKNQKKKLERLEYLKDQVWIAKELNITDNQISMLTKNNDIPYYLLGYKAISKEIEVIEKNLKKNRTSIFEKKLNLLKETSDFKIFNVNLSYEVKLLKDTKLILMIFTLLGLIIGILYVSISNLSQFKFIFRNKY